MKVLLTIIATFLVVLACGGKTKVDVEDSEHDLNVRFEVCETFEDPKEKQDCIKKLLDAMEKCDD